MHIPFLLTQTHIQNMKKICRTLIDVNIITRNGT